MPSYYRFSVAKEIGNIAVKSVGFLVLLAIAGCIAEDPFPPSPYNCDNLPQIYKDLPETPAYNFVLWRSPSVSIDDFEDALLTTMSSQIIAYSPDFLRIWVNDTSIQNVTLSPKTRSDGAILGAVIGLSLPSVVEAEAIAAELEPQVAFLAGYQSLASLPMDYNKTWGDGERSPGLISMSFFHKPTGQSAEQFKSYWFCSHTPFAVDIHPLWRYQRFAVTQAFTADAPPYDGIVPLHLQIDSDFQFDNYFGADGNSPIANSLRIQNDVNNFLNLEKIETTAMREYVIKE